MRGLLVTMALAALAVATGADAAAAVSAAANATKDVDTSSSAAVITSVGTPDGFEQLARPREIVVDLYFGGQKIGEAKATAGLGLIRFSDPAKVARLVPGIVDADVVTRALATDLRTNADRICASPAADDCGRLDPEVAGLIYDEDRFRVDLFVAPRLLKAQGTLNQVYLATPTSPLSLTSSIAAAVSGSNSHSPTYNLQNRTIVGYRNARLRSDGSLSSGGGVLVDDFVGELDRKDLRFSGGLFWAPGIDLIGRRRMLGVGVSTQFDTRVDRESLNGTPIVLFLNQSSRVDLLVDGRLVTSRGYDAGNNLIDTSALPQGSYSLVLQIHEIGGHTREERRFFVKNAQIAPVGKPIVFAFAGMLATTRKNRLVSVSKDMFYQVGTARRLNQSLAVDLSVIGTQHKTIAEAGTWLITAPARIRTAALVSSAGDKAALVEVQSSSLGRLSLAFDLRRIWTKDGRPLLPTQTFIGGFDAVPVTNAQLGGSFLQVSGSAGYRFGRAFLSVIGSLRKDRGDRASYSVGPDFRWAAISHKGIQLIVQANAQRTRDTTASYVGLQLFSSLGPLSIVSSGGHAAQSKRDGSGRNQSRAVGDVSAQYFYAGADRTEINFGAGVDRSIDSTLGHAEATAYTRFGSARGDIWHNLEGPHDTQYGLTLETGIALGKDQLAVGGRDVSESAVVVAVDGSAPTGFDVLVDGQSRGHLYAGSRLPLFLQPYHAYKVRLRPLTASGVSFDSAARNVTLFPGNVQTLRWTVWRTATIFAQALAPSGRPIIDAMIQSSQGVGQTDSSGYFQVDAKDGDILTFSGSSADSCKVALGKVIGVKDFVSLGKLICR